MKRLWMAKANKRRHVPLSFLKAKEKKSRSRTKSVNSEVQWRVPVPRALALFFCWGTNDARPHLHKQENRSLTKILPSGIFPFDNVSIDLHGNRVGLFLSAVFKHRHFHRHNALVGGKCHVVIAALFSRNCQRRDANQRASLLWKFDINSAQSRVRIPNLLPMKSRVCWSLTDNNDFKAVL